LGFIPNFNAFLQPEKDLSLHLFAKPMTAGRNGPESLKVTSMEFPPRAHRKIFTKKQCTNCAGLYAHAMLDFAGSALSPALDQGGA